MRRKRWLLSLSENRLDGFLVTHPANLSYLFNFTGSAGLACCVDGETMLFVDSRYIEQAGNECVNCLPSLAEGSLEVALQTWLEDLSSSSGTRQIGVEARNISYALVLHLQSWKADLQLVATYDLVEEIRMTKDGDEIRTLERAFQIAQQAYRRSVDHIQPGMTEVEVAGILELELRKAGGDGPSFDTIVASGHRSSLPHGRASAKRIATDDVVLIDFGAKYRGYCSDLTRIYRTPGTTCPDIFSVVQEAQSQAVAVVKPGILSSEIDSAARKVIQDHGYGDYFKHDLGHGLGLEVHELPRISANRPNRLQEGMVFTIEPGIYLPGKHGIRIEDAVVVTENGCRMLSDPGG